MPLPGNKHVISESNSFFYFNKFRYALNMQGKLFSKLHVTEQIGNLASELVISQFCHMASQIFILKQVVP